MTYKLPAATLRIIRAVTAASLALAIGSAFAQSYPNRPIRLIVPFGPGGGSDYVGRLVAQKLTDQMGQTVVVDNRTGAASLVGTELAMRAAPDGYTLLLGDSGLPINLAYFKNASYNPTKDFAPITVVAETPYILVANPGLPYASSLKEFVAAAKAQPGKLTIGSSGSGSGSHFSGELFRLRAGVNMIHVPYKGGGAVLADVVSGQIQSTMTSLPAVQPLVKAGRVKILAAASAKRSPLMPDVPTFTEGGVNDVVVTNWYGVLSVGGTPQPIVKRLHDELLRAIATPDMRERLTSTALEPSPLTPEEFGRKITAEVERWKRVASESGIRQE